MRGGSGVMRGLRCHRFVAVSVALAIAASLGGCIGLVGALRGAAPYAIQNPGLSTRTGAQEPTAANLRNALGEPDRIVATADGERWHYREGLRWQGVAILLLVVPVPLLLPTGRQEAVITLVEGRAVSLEGHDNVSLGRAGCLWGSFSSLTSQRGCFSEGSASPRPELRRDGATLWLAPEPLRRDQKSTPR